MLEARREEDLSTIAGKFSAVEAAVSQNKTNIGHNVLLGM